LPFHAADYDPHRPECIYVMLFPDMWVMPINVWE